MRILAIIFASFCFMGMALGAEPIPRLFYKIPICPQVEIPNWETLTDQQTAKLLKDLYNANKVCRESINTLKSELAEVRHQLSHKAVKHHRHHHKHHRRHHRRHHRIAYSPWHHVYHFGGCVLIRY
jgi:hypothetical protein